MEPVTHGDVMWKEEEGHSMVSWAAHTVPYPHRPCKSREASPADPEDTEAFVSPTSPGRVEGA